MTIRQSVVPSILDDPITEAKAAIERGIEAIRMDDYETAEREFAWANNNILTVHSIVKHRNRIQ